VAAPGHIALLHLAAEGELATSIATFLREGKGLPVACVAAPAPEANGSAADAALKTLIGADAILVLWTRASSEAAWFAAFLAPEGAPPTHIGLRVGPARIPAPFDRFQVLDLPPDPAVLALSLTVLGAMLGTKPPEVPPEPRAEPPGAAEPPPTAPAAEASPAAVPPRAPRRRWRFWSRRG
jgi:hypothetical protein